MFTACEKMVLQTDLAQFYGSENLYRHFSGICYTDGVKFLADKAEAYWLIDAIASWQKTAMKDKMLQEFQIWRLKRIHNIAENHFSLICERDTNNEAFRQEIEFSDFPLDEIKLYLENGVLCLPSER